MVYHCITTWSQGKSRVANSEKTPSPEATGPWRGVGIAYFDGEAAGHSLPLLTVYESHVNENRNEQDGACCRYGREHRRDQPAVFGLSEQTVNCRGHAEQYERH